ncbi:uncharacterized protein LOC133797586 [Humulus lupulus]|uniref:uncharacterized protein LOC133797586 n=1 Tax=Humulus lupulus TaxID=3486 RepID=UPI002B409052|nr:uncharacterized protein LOC133797586 [Humulus lupulus]
MVVFPLAIKIKHFIWRFCHHLLPTTTQLVSHHIFASPFCFYNTSQVKSTSHALLGCSSAKKIWKNTYFYQFSLANSHLDIFDLILMAWSGFDLPKLELFLCLLWASWNNRNNHFFKKKKRLQAHEIMDKPHLSEQLKLNVDAAFEFKNRRMGFGTVVRNHQEEVIAGLVSLFMY